MEINELDAAAEALARQGKGDWLVDYTYLDTGALRSGIWCVFRVHTGDWICSDNGSINHLASVMAFGKSPAAAIESAQDILHMRRKAINLAIDSFPVP